MTTPTETLVKALRVLAVEIQSGDGVANAAIAEAADRLEELSNQERNSKFKLGDYVRKIKGSEWEGRIVGTYSTKLTPEYYCVESFWHAGSVQICPAAALEKVTG